MTATDTHLAGPRKADLASGALVALVLIPLAAMLARNGELAPFPWMNPAGLVRGFSGFGTAMIYLPVASQFLTPFEALITLMVMDFFGPLPLVLGAAGFAIGLKVG